MFVKVKSTTSYLIITSEKQLRLSELKWFFQGHKVSYSTARNRNSSSDCNWIIFSMLDLHCHMYTLFLSFAFPFWLFKALSDQQQQHIQVPFTCICDKGQKLGKWEVIYICSKYRRKTSLFYYIIQVLDILKSISDLTNYSKEFFKGWKN